jgi:hypothetical protein
MNDIPWNNNIPWDKYYQTLCKEHAHVKFSDFCYDLQSG